jgi:thioredoxin-like negative regulator of GroEL
MDSTTPQVKSALARCYVALNKPEMAKNIYEDLERGNNNDTWSAEARSQLQELLVKYPNLVKPAAPAPVAGSSNRPVTLPAATNK